MKYENLGWFAVGVAFMSAACLIELTPNFIEPDEDCVVGAIDCPCTSGSGCDPGLECIAEVCVPLEENDGDGDGEHAGAGDGDGDGDADADGAPGTLYGPCPSGDNAECTSPQFCVTGTRHGTAWSLCTTACARSSECVVDDQDDCSDLPGDGWHRLRCAPLIECGASNPCPRGMQCVIGIVADAPTVCVWPDP